MGRVSCVWAITTHIPSSSWRKNLYAANMIDLKPHRRLRNSYINERLACSPGRVDIVNRNKHGERFGVLGHAVDGEVHFWLEDEMACPNGLDRRHFTHVPHFDGPAAVNAQKLRRAWQEHDLGDGALVRAVRFLQCDRDDRSVEHD